MRRAARATPPAPAPFFPEGLPIRATYSSRGGGGGGGVAFGSGPTRSPRARRVIRRRAAASDGNVKREDRARLFSRRFVAFLVASEVQSAVLRASITPSDDGRVAAFGRDRRTRLFIDARLVLRARARATSVRPARSRRRVRVRPRRARTSLARGRTRAGGREPPPVPRSPFVFTVSSVGPSPDDDARFPRATSSPAAAASRLTRGDALFDGRSRHRARGVRASLALSRRGVSSRRR